jgi:hypothetical protein
VANEYASLADLKGQLGVTDTSKDVLLFRALSAASKAVERRTKRKFWLDETPVQRTLNPHGRVVNDERGSVLLVNDIGDLDSLAVETGSGTSFSAVTGYETWPDDALGDGFPVTALLLATTYWATGTNRVRITARWGWPSVPDEIVQATLLQAARLYRRKDSPDGVSNNPGLAGEDWISLRIPSLDPDVRTLIDPFVLPGFG